MRPQLSDSAFFARSLRSRLLLERSIGGEAMVARRGGGSFTTGSKRRGVYQLFMLTIGGARVAS